MIIYLITNIVNGKQYVGQTRRKAQRRWRQHITDSKHKSALHNAINKYGEDSFYLQILDEANSQEELNELERHWIFELSTLKPSGYNLTTGGGADYTVSESTRQKVSASWENREISSETKTKMSESWKKKFALDPEHKAKKVAHLAKAYGHNRVPILCKENETTYVSITAAARALGVDATMISRQLKGKCRRVKGFTFEYAG